MVLLCNFYFSIVYKCLGPAPEKIVLNFIIFRLIILNNYSWYGAVLYCLMQSIRFRSGLLAPALKVFRSSPSSLHLSPKKGLLTNHFKTFLFLFVYRRNSMILNELHIFQLFFYILEIIYFCFMNIFHLFQYFKLLLFLLLHLLHIVYCVVVRIYVAYSLCISFFGVKTLMSLGRLLWAVVFCWVYMHIGLFFG